MDRSVDFTSRSRGGHRTVLGTPGARRAIRDADHKTRWHSAKARHSYAFVRLCPSKLGVELNFGSRNTHIRTEAFVLRDLQARTREAAQGTFRCRHRRPRLVNNAGFRCSECMCRPWLGVMRPSYDLNRAGGKGARVIWPAPAYSL